MQNQNNTNNTNNRNHVTKRLSPLGYCAAGIVGLILLILFGRLILLLAVIGGIGWLAWKFRRAIRNVAEQLRISIENQNQMSWRKDRNIQQQSDDNPDVNPFQHSNSYQSASWNNGGASGSGRRNAIFDVIPNKECK